MFGVKYRGAVHLRIRSLTTDHEISILTLKPLEAFIKWIHVLDRTETTAEFPEIVLERRSNAMFIHSLRSTGLS